jgi:voltage-gated potassium channel
MSPPTRTHHSTRDQELERFRRRLTFAFAALIGVTLIGIVGFWIIADGTASVIDSMYMTIITLTTVGFSEVIDLSTHPYGRLFTIVLLLGGMGVVAYTVPMATGFLIEGQLHNVFARRRMQKRIGDMVDHYIVCGDTATSWHVAEELVKTQRDVVVIAPTDEAIEDAHRRLGDIPTLQGDPSNDDLLAAAGVSRAAGIVFSMESDKDNVIGALTARRLAPAVRIVSAAEELEAEAKLRSVGADAVVSPARIGGLRMASELVRPTVVTFLDKMLRQKGGTLRVEEINVPDDAAVGDRSIHDMRIDDMAGVLLVAIRLPGTGEFEFKPDPDTKILAGMTLVVMTDADGLGRLRSRFRSATGTQLRIDDPD